MVVRVVRNNWDTGRFASRQRIAITRATENVLVEAIAVIDDITPEDTGFTRESIAVLRQPPTPRAAIRFFFGANVRHIVPYLRYIHNPNRALNFQRPGATSHFTIPGLRYVERVLGPRIRRAVSGRP